MPSQKILSVAQAAELLGISKEAVYNRLRRGSLQSVQKNGVKMVIIQEWQAGQEKIATEPTFNDQGEFISYLKEQISELKAQNQQLLQDKEKLYNEKESIIIQSKNEIKQSHKERDERLLQFLSSFNKPLIADTIDVEPIEQSQKWLSLSAFVNGLNLDKKKHKKITKKLIQQAGYSKYIKYQDGLILIRKNKELEKILKKV